MQPKLLLVLHLITEDENLDTVLDEMRQGFDYSADEIIVGPSWTGLLVTPQQLLEDVFANACAWQRLEDKGIECPFVYTVHAEGASNEEIQAAFEAQFEDDEDADETAGSTTTSA
jgi:hypothetical protein